MLDEPAAGLTTPSRRSCAGGSWICAGPDRVILIVEARHETWSWPFSDHIVVLQPAAACCFEGPPATVRENPDVQEAYLGSPDEHQIIPRRCSPSNRSRPDTGGPRYCTALTPRWWRARSSPSSAERRRQDDAAQHDLRDLRPSPRVDPLSRARISRDCGPTRSSPAASATARRDAASSSASPSRKNLIASYVAAGRGPSPRWVRRAYRLFPVLGERRKEPGQNRFSGGQQQMAGGGRALMAQPGADAARRTVARPGAEAGQPDPGRFVLNLAGTGMSIVLVEQNVDAALEISDYATSSRTDAASSKARARSCSPTTDCARPICPACEGRPRAALYCGKRGSRRGVGPMRKPSGSGSAGSKHELVKAGEKARPVTRGVT